MIMDAAGEVGFIKKNKHGKPTATGLDGCRGYLRWLALHHPQTYAALMARVLPYYVNAELPEEILSRDDTKQDQG
jgi:hypothetical protein